jgi:hypothetical protein
LFFNDTATTEIYTLHYTLSLHDARPSLNCEMWDVRCEMWDPPLLWRGWGRWPSPPLEGLGEGTPPPLEGLGEVTPPPLEGLGEVRCETPNVETGRAPSLQFQRETFALSCLLRSLRKLFANFVVKKNSVYLCVFSVLRIVVRNDVCVTRKNYTMRITLINPVHLDNPCIERSEISTIFVQDFFLLVHRHLKKILAKIRSFKIQTSKKNYVYDLIKLKVMFSICIAKKS